MSRDSSSNDMWLGAGILALLFVGFLLFNIPELFFVPFFLFGAFVFSWVWAVSRSATSQECLCWGLWPGFGLVFVIYYFVGLPFRWGEYLGLWPGIFFMDWIADTQDFVNWGFNIHFIKKIHWAPFSFIDGPTLRAIWWSMGLVGSLGSLFWPASAFTSDEGPRFNEEDRRDPSAKKNDVHVPKFTGFAEEAFKAARLFWWVLLFFPNLAEKLGKNWARLMAGIVGFVFGSFLVFLWSNYERVHGQGPWVDPMMHATGVAFFMSAVHFIWAEKQIIFRDLKLEEQALQKKETERLDRLAAVERKKSFDEEQARRLEQKAQSAAAEAVVSSEDSAKEKTTAVSKSGLSFWSDPNNDKF